MKKIVCFGLCFMIVLCSFVLCFADGGSPVILPVSDGTSGLDIVLSNNVIYRYYANVSPVYLVWARWNNTNHVLVFSEDSSAIVNFDNLNTGVSTSYSLTSSYNGFYYTSNVNLVPKNNSYILDGDFTSVYDVIDFVDSSVFSTTFDITYIVDGSVSWLSSMARAVKNNGLLLFFVLTVFVGVGIGLLNRFRRD